MFDDALAFNLETPSSLGFHDFLQACIPIEVDFLEACIPMVVLLVGRFGTHNFLPVP